MKRFLFCFVLVFLTASGVVPVSAQTSGETAAAEDENPVANEARAREEGKRKEDRQLEKQAIIERLKALDPDAPAAESPIKVRIPHSDRTKENFADAMLDFLLTKLFKQFDEVVITYDFFSLAEMGDLAFKGLTVELKKPSVTGKITFSKFQVSLKELLLFLRTREAVIGRVLVEDVKADLKELREKDGKKSERRILFSTQSAEFKKVQIMEMVRKQRPEVGNREVKVEVASGKSIVLSFPDTKESYAAAAAEMNNFEVRKVAPYWAKFESAVVDGKPYSDWEALQAAVRRK